MIISYHADTQAVYPKRQNSNGRFSDASSNFMVSFSFEPAVAKQNLIEKHLSEKVDRNYTAQRSNNPTSLNDREHISSHNHSKFSLYASCDNYLADTT